MVKRNSTMSGNDLRNWRKNRGMNQLELAVRLGSSINRVALNERRRRLKIPLQLEKEIRKLEKYEMLRR